MVQIRRWFDANGSISLCEISLQFVLKSVIVWLSMLCNSLKYGAYLEWGRLSFWILQSIQGNCKVCWKVLTYILPLRMWGCSMRFSWIMERPPSAPPKEGSTSLGHLLKRRNKFVCMLITFISSKIFLDILGCRLRQGGLKCKEKRANGNLPRPLPRRGARAWSLFLRHEMNLFVCSCPLYLLKFSTIFLDVACDEEG